LRSAAKLAWLIAVLASFFLFAQPSPALAGALYTVRTGDTLYRLGLVTGLPFTTIMKDNKLKTTTIYPGQRLWLRDAPGFTYRVRRGDTLFLLARRFGTTTAALYQANGLKNSTIYPGQLLRIPTERPAAASRGANPTWTAADLRLLARLVYAEARGEPYIGQVAVAAVALNRLKHPLFPKTLAGVIFQPGALSAVLDGQINLAPNAAALRAARQALAGWDPTGGALYYWNPGKATSRWVWTRPIIARFGNHVFAL